MTSLYTVLCLFIHKSSSKQGRDTTASKLNFMLLTANFMEFGIFTFGFSFWIVEHIAGEFYF